MSYSELWPHERESYMYRSRRAFTMDIPDAVLEIAGIDIVSEHQEITARRAVDSGMGILATDAVVLVFPQQPAEHVQNAIPFAA